MQPNQDQRDNQSSEPTPSEYQSPQPVPTESTNPEPYASAPVQPEVQPTNQVANPSPWESQSPAPVVEPQAQAYAPAPVQPQQPAATQPSSTTAASAAINPGKTFGIISLITSIIGIGLAGVIFGILGLIKSKKAGFKNPLALVGLILGAIGVVLFPIVFFVLMSALNSVQKSIKDNCTQTTVGTTTSLNCGSSNTTTPTTPNNSSNFSN